ncbi:MAG: DUF3891 family protein [Gemmatimonadota bacterium]
MLVQIRRDGHLRFIRQHEHALLSGQLAAAWCGPGREAEPLPFEVVFAVALHDLSWRKLDATPRVDPALGRPPSFYEIPLDERLAAYSAGLDEVERIHPYAALLASLHYASFPELRAVDPFQSGERERRDRLRRALDLGPEDEGRVQHHLAFLRLFDNLSLFLCLTPPAAACEELPDWVDACRHSSAPDGATIHLTWVGDEVVHVDPFPFRAPLAAGVRYRELEAEVCGDEPALRAAWRSTEPRFWSIDVRPAPRLA